MRYAVGERGRGNEEPQDLTSVWEALRSVEYASDQISSWSQSEHRATVTFKTIDHKR